MSQAELTPKERRDRILDWLRTVGLGLKPKSYFAESVDPGFPVEVCEICGAVIDATLWEQHQARCQA
jgi:hypothetical protein